MIATVFFDCLRVWLSIGQKKEVKNSPKIPLLCLDMVSFASAGVITNVIQSMTKFGVLFCDLPEQDYSVIVSVITVVCGKGKWKFSGKTCFL